jgi:hypothetical protein
VGASLSIRGTKATGLFRLSFPLAFYAILVSFVACGPQAASARPGDPEGYDLPGYLGNRDDEFQDQKAERLLRAYKCIPYKLKWDFESLIHDFERHVVYLDGLAREHYGEADAAKRYG